MGATKSVCIEFDEECQSCKGTGLYVGMAERDGYAVVCHTCGGTGCHHFRHMYQPFSARRENDAVTRVLQVNPGICAGGAKDFGGLLRCAWEALPDPTAFPPATEMRAFTCPAWWYQSADYDKMPRWNECRPIGKFSECPRFCRKAECWARWDREHKND